MIRRLINKLPNLERGYETRDFVTWTCYRCGERFREYYLEMEWTE